LRQSGFSLLEVLVTLAIVAIVAGLAIPGMRGVIGDSELSAASNRLVFGLQTARSEAIKRITPVSLCPSTNPEADEPSCGGSYAQGWIVFVDVDGDGLRNGSADDLIVRGEPLSPAFTVLADDSVRSGVRFGISGVSTNVTGIPIAGGIEILHAGKAEKRAVRIAASGRISMSAINDSVSTLSDSLSSSDDTTSTGTSAQDDTL